MTIEQLNVKRDEILTHVGEARVSFGDRSVEYADATKALAVIDAEIARTTNAEAGTGRFRTSFVSFVR
jgi:hypothetical protein